MHAKKVSIICTQKTAYYMHVNVRFCVLIARKLIIWTFCLLKVQFIENTVADFHSSQPRFHSCQKLNRALPECIGTELFCIDYIYIQSQTDT